jgi:hypothetical protein
MREEYEKRAQEYWARYYKQLVGATIISFEGMNKDESMEWDEGFPCFKVKFKDGTYGLLEISKDEEGNGGGVIFGLFQPEMDDYDKKHGLNQYAKAKS